MRRAMLLTVAAVFVLSLATVAGAGEQCDKPCHDKDKAKMSEASAPAVFDSPQDAGTKAACPVTGETFKIGENTQHSEVDGKHVYFCCSACKPKFDENPEKYLHRDKEKS